MNGDVSGGVRRLVGAVLDAVLPPRCLGCGNLVGSGGILCSRCWEKITFPGDPQCDTCGLPFEFDPGPGALCGACIGKKPAYDHARAAMIYDDASRGLVL
ncbi:MAG TPA: ComF family protein, partial [Alphaproteobacteria bacterium]|nr:ComF family protein [Alphaproteobacteria bacterium]